MRKFIVIGPILHAWKIVKSSSDINLRINNDI